MRGAVDIRTILVFGNDVKYFINYATSYYVFKFGKTNKHLKNTQILFFF